MKTKLFRKIKQRINDILSVWSVAGFSKVYELVIIPHCGSKKTAIKRQIFKREIIMAVLRRKYASFISQQTKVFKQDKFTPQAPIWVCWWQGETAMPPIVKMCYQSLLCNSQNHPVHLITKENINNYIQLPYYIIKKVEQKRITFTHLSDIIRMTLLYEYGGLWVDATVYVSRPIPEEIFQSSFFTLAPRSQNTTNISDARWTGFLIGGFRQGILFQFARNFLFEYWKQENRLLDYFLIDYIIALAYETQTEIAHKIDSLPTSHTEINQLAELLNKPYEPIIFNQLNESLIFHKLSYKQPLYTTTIDQKETFYKHLLAKFNT